MGYWFMEYLFLLFLWLKDNKLSYFLDLDLERVIFVNVPSLT